MFTASISMGCRIPIPGHSQIVLNDQGQTVNLSGMTAGTTDLVMGDGDDVMERSGSWVRLNIYAPRGNNVIRLGRSPGMAQGGDGFDVIYGNDNRDTIYTGMGGAQVFAEAGDDTIVAQGGVSRIDAGDGDDTIILEGGSNTVYGGKGADTIIVKRTGLVQTILDLGSADVLDLSAWAPLQPATVRRIGSDVHITAGMETVICKGRTVAQVTPSITGVTYVEG